MVKITSGAIVPIKAMQTAVAARVSATIRATGRRYLSSRRLEHAMANLSSSVGDLASRFSGRLLMPGSAEWEAARRVHNGLVDKHPALIAQCLGSADIASTVRFARERGLEIAVRAGGHNVGGKACCEGGVMIDLSLMKHVHVAPEQRAARAAGGTLWGHFNRETQLHGLATTGGVVSTTGVAGLTLGGGVGWLMPKHAMALDNLESVEMVLADGNVMRAGAHENADLFWAVRGGGGNFGIASSLEFRLHPVGPDVIGGLVAWPVDRAPDVLRLFRELAAKANDDLMLVCALITGPDATTKLVAIAAGYFGDAASGDKAVWPIKSLGQPVKDAMGPISYTALNSMLDVSYPAGARNYWKAHFCESLTDEAIDTIVDAFMRCPSPMGQLLIEHFHGAASRIAPTETAFALRADGFNVLVLSQWMSPADDAVGTKWSRDAYAAIRSFGGPSRYLNYFDQDDTGDQALTAAYGPNLRRLQQVKAKYDPENVFHLNVNIPPKA
ncbi:FAD-binding oxidoreductase [Azohydromonas caseinilytica]|uniref:FAD-binding oxidoreductase n=1 Tax=Azohydromonas caseinilytica TaxID=2728836 RepID=A0A848FIW8_9BURK|nr:FAD-binding oxidoreductase [Azohydromonas caseinilytica]NML18140.1 FAD-binding oxidoreductase [Azohydromonas caseinilytica]